MFLQGSSLVLTIPPGLFNITLGAIDVEVLVISIANGGLNATVTAA